MERRLEYVSFDKDEKVKIRLFEENHIASEEKEGSDEVGDDETDVDDHAVGSKRKPHKDFTDCFKKLRRLALAACDIGVEPKEITDSWNVVAIKISGNIDMQTSRVVMTLQKFVKRTGKYIKFNTPQITMYPEKDDTQRFHDVEKMTPIIEDLQEECWAYIDGIKTGEDKKKAAIQMPLFPAKRVHMKVA